MDNNKKRQKKSDFLFCDCIPCDYNAIVNENSLDITTTINKLILLSY